MNLFRSWHDLTDSERSQVVLTLLIAMFFSMVTIYGFLVSRGNDVDYFKDRMTLMEQRINYMDQKLDKINESAGDTKRTIAELRQTLEQQQRELEEHRKWIEHWKTLPQLPKPSQKR